MEGGGPDGVCILATRRGAADWPPPGDGALKLLKNEPGDVAEDCAPPGDGALKLPKSEPGDVGQCGSRIEDDGDIAPESRTGDDGQCESECRSGWERLVCTVTGGGERARLSSPLETIGAWQKAPALVDRSLEAKSLASCSTALACSSVTTFGAGAFESMKPAGAVSKVASPGLR